jgi:hypothetical protein
VECDEFLELVLPHIPPGEVRRRTALARDMIDEPVQDVADFIGSGFEVSAQDTVPFCLWCAGQHLDHWEETLWLTVAGLGDRDCRRNRYDVWRHAKRFIHLAGCA